MCSTTASAVAATAVVCLYILYKLALPKPLHGIPYNEKSANRLLGDIPDLVAHMSKGGDLIEWLTQQHLKSNSAIQQLFLRPFAKPMILIADYRESREIMAYRTKDFDRSKDVCTILRPVVGTNQFAQPTGPEWKLHRRLVQDTMSPAFLQGVVAPSIYASCETFISLWEAKAAIAKGRPFSASDDLFFATLDAVCAFTFGSAFPYKAIQPQVCGYKTLSAHEFVSEDMDEPVELPWFGIDENINSMIRLVDGVEKAQSSPSPPLTWLMTKATPSFRRAQKIKDKCIRREIEKAIESEKQHHDDEDESWVRNAVDHIIDRENKLAEKEDRKPDYFSQMIMDEIYGFILAGHDSTSTTMCWSTKLLSEHQVWQRRLRGALQSAFPAAKSENRRPTVREIMEISVPDLDATIEETLRYRPTAPIGTRDAVRDTTVLGCPVPKGTTIMWIFTTSSFIRPAVQVDEERRTQRSQEEKNQGRAIEWDDEDIGFFKPERWLKQDETGKLAFDGIAGPTTPFGMGPRSCFGRKLAYVQMKIILTMMIWSFELLECPKKLSGHSARLALTYKPHQCFVRLNRIDLETEQDG